MPPGLTPPHRAWLATIPLGILGLAGLAVAFTTTTSEPIQWREASTLGRDALDAHIYESDYPMHGVLALHVRVLGDAREHDTAPARAWLRERAGIQLTESERGLPVYLTQRDLIGPSGHATVGASAWDGIAIEVDATDANCVLVHEILHYVGLPHVEDPGNVMFETGAFPSECGELDANQVASISRLARVEAVTPRGVETWVERV